MRVQGEDVLMPVSGVEMLGSEVSEGHSEGDRAREPQPTVSVIPPDEGQQESQDGQHLPGAKDLSRGQVSVMSCPAVWEQVEGGRVGVAAEVIGRTGQRTGMDPLPPGIPMDAFRSRPFSIQSENEDNPCFIVLHHESLRP